VEDLDAAGRVPLVVAGGPRQGGAEGLDQVVKAPGQNHDVVGVAEEHDDHGGVTQTCREHAAEPCFRGEEHGSADVRSLKLRRGS